MNIFSLVLSQRMARPFGVHSVPKGSVRAGLLAIILLAAKAEAITYSGRVVDQSTGAGVPGVRVNYSWVGSPGFVTTDGNGNWSSPGWINIGGTVTFNCPDQAGFTFSPGSRSYMIGLSSVSGVDFTRISYAISGNISRGGVGLGGVTVSLTGPASRSGTTSPDGNYNHSQLPPGSYTITPSFPGFSFSPASRTGVNLGPSRAGQDFRLLNPIAIRFPANPVG